MKNERQITFTAYDIEGAELRTLAQSLDALGLSCKLDKRPRGRVRVHITFPGEHDAKKSRTRRAGRNPTYNRYTSPVFKSGTTAEDALAWLDAHTPAEGAEALVCSRSTYFRRRDRIREAVEERRDLEERRKAAGRDPLPPLLLGDVLGRKKS